ncbi:hypothetical protein G5V59_21350 [Nocardioides sp. W3-2-3]|uniref:hypothetical protein n=1 Tax=Nocardioides convexus TaxID=2712224 RepID=UPI00241868B5|nr:hypothetical protein [Nocardioides convexus]NHA01489.1 hypothetical protein [Nocardioides convexus]
MRRISGPRGWVRRGRSARGTAELSVVVVAGSLLAGLVFGNGLARTSLDLTDGLRLAQGRALRPGAAGQPAHR